MVTLVCIRLSRTTVKPKVLIPIGISHLIIFNPTALLADAEGACRFKFFELAEGADP